jgi:hypothetical protein
MILWEFALSEILYLFYLTVLSFCIRALYVRHIDVLFIQNLSNDWLIDWCLTPTLAIFQLYRDAYYTNVVLYILHFFILSVVYFTFLYSVMTMSYYISCRVYKGRRESICCRFTSYHDEGKRRKDDATFWTGFSNGLHNTQMYIVRSCLTAN